MRSPSERHANGCGIGFVFGALRLVNLAYGRSSWRVPSPSPWRPVGLARVGRDRLLLRGRARPLDADGPARLPPPSRSCPAVMLIATFAVRSSCRTSRFCGSGRSGRLLRRCVPEPAVDDFERRHPQDRSRFGGRRSVYLLPAGAARRTDIELRMRLRRSDFETAHARRPCRSRDRCRGNTVEHSRRWSP